MNLIALLIGLIIERLATQLFHLRELRWLDRIIDSGFHQAKRFANWPASIPVILLVVMLVLPVIVIRLLIFSLGDALLGFPYLVLAIVVLFFSLGPKDIGENVVEYCHALEDADDERIQRTAKVIVESDVPDDPRERIHRVEQAVCVQANNRLFAVIFWFVVLGPLGAWTYRVTDLIRRRAVFNVSRQDDENETTAEVRDASAMLHGWFAWVPARLTAIGYAIAGHFDGALAAWRKSDDKSENPRLKPDEVEYIHYGFYYVIPGKEKEFEALAGEFVELYKSNNIDSGWVIFQSITGSDLPVLVVAHAAKSSADYYSNRERVREVVGEEAKKLGEKVGALVRKMEFKEGMLRPDLSYPEPTMPAPAKKY